MLGDRLNGTPIKLPSPPEASHAQEDLAIVSVDFHDGVSANTEQGARNRNKSQNDKWQTK